ncbi:MAG: L-aspartate oxidase [Gemmatimonadetes bacterium]|nr:L-aspartate oxidase [Gemmatimonadota bacterium]
MTSANGLPANLPPVDGATTDPGAEHVADVIVIGSGVAGLSAAVELARRSPTLSVCILTRGRTGGHGASSLAQGGVAAALDPSDSPELHALDTEMAADGLARSELVEILTRDGPDRVRELMRLGARFDRAESGSLSLGLEGAHSRHRILHAQGDRTGAEVMRALRVAVISSPQIRVLEETEVLELDMAGERVTGVLARHAAGGIRLFRAPAILLATGGPGRVYLHTTAPRGLDGDGIAIAARAGARLRDLEFIQFHPTALNVDADPLPLVTEALRGAGARLVDELGHSVHDAGGGGDLASRDRMARAMWRRMQEGGSVFLDCRAALGERIRTTFPGVYALCLKHGVDPVREPIPVTPAAHYHMGGVAVDAEGRTSLPGLWAAGEAAASGLHGANRLASNSLLEGLVFGPIAARSIAGALTTSKRSGRAAGAWPDGEAGEGRGSSRSRLPIATESAGLLAQSPDRAADTPLPPEVVERIRTLMWERVGIVRNGTDLEHAIEELHALESDFGSSTSARSRNILLTARLIAQAALLRQESLGSHFREDFPRRSGSRPRHSVLTLSPSATGGIRAAMEEDPAAPSDLPCSSVGASVGR